MSATHPQATRPAGVAARQRIGAGLRYAAAVVVLVWILAPFAFLLLVAVQTRPDALSIPPVWLPRPDLSNFRTILGRAFETGPPVQTSDLILPGILNSARVAIAVAALNVILGSVAGYAFARFRFVGSRTIPFAMLGSQMVPAFALIVPYFVVFRQLGLTNTRVGAAVALVSITLPFTVWLLRAYFSNVPVALERAARIDGCSRITAFRRVVLPLACPGLISTGLFAFMVAWNDFLFALVLNSEVAALLVQPALAGLYNVREQSFGLMAAGAILAALPTMVLAVATQRFLVRGLLAGAEKG